MKASLVRAWNDRDGVAFETTIELDAESSGRPAIEGSLALAHRLSSLRLPRVIGQDQLKKPLSMLLAIPSLEDARRIFGMSPRNRLVARSQGQTLLQVGLETLGEDRRDAGATRDLLAQGGAMPSETVALVARSIVPTPKSPAEAALAVVSWVQREMNYELVPESLDDATILKERRGDCSEYAQITVALLRSLGIPAQTRGGFAVAGSSLLAHAWVAFHDGRRWVEIDPTTPDGRITSGTIEASLVDALGLLAIDALSVISVE
jgi:transglutaminase-like putative cysteine protease